MARAQTVDFAFLILADDVKDASKQTTKSGDRWVTPATTPWIRDKSGAVRGV